MVASPEAAGVKSVGGTCTHRHVHVHIDSTIGLGSKAKPRPFVLTGQGLIGQCFCVLIFVGHLKCSHSVSVHRLTVTYDKLINEFMYPLFLCLCFFLRVSHCFPDQTLGWDALYVALTLSPTGPSPLLLFTLKTLHWG